MSCKVHQPEDAPQVGAVVWRSAGSAPVAKSTGPVAASTRPVVDEAVALRAQMAQLQQQYEQRVRDAQATGMREGEAAGRVRAVAEMQPVMDRLARSIEEIGG